tara:strand:- start:838 stop:1488 length:651 start_codon:yes stop_codon:yes gene_type:complete
MTTRTAKLVKIKLKKSAKCHSDKYLERLIDSPALKYKRELNYIYITVPKNKPHLVNKNCLNEYYSWLSEYLQEEIERLANEREKIKAKLSNGKFSEEERNFFGTLLTKPTVEQIKGAIAFNPKKDKSLVITNYRMLVALRKELNGLITQGHNELLEEIDAIYNNRISNVSDLIVKYENTLNKFSEKINNMETNMRIFNRKINKTKKNTKIKSRLRR